MIPVAREHNICSFPQTLEKSINHWYCCHVLGVGYSELCPYAVCIETPLLCRASIGAPLSTRMWGGRGSGFSSLDLIRCSAVPTVRAISFDVIGLFWHHTDAAVLVQFFICCCLQVQVVINDRVDVALATGADGVHIGQDDIPAALARRLLGPQKILGVSVKTVEQARQAQEDGADYLGAGAGRLCRL